jgi:Protein of unknown function (DUF3089)
MDWLHFVSAIVGRRAALLGAIGLSSAVVCAFEARAASPSPNGTMATSRDYADPAHWLCRPGRADTCAANLDATVIAEDGSTTREAFHADPDAPIDCFYIYPTVSQEPAGNADFAIDKDLTFVTVQQFARFGARCRPFAPVYRQITVPALLSMFAGKPMPMDPELAYGDVLAARRSYLANDNHGRGFVLIGHSQGTTVLARLIREEIDGKPIQAQLVSALLFGSSPGDLVVKSGDASARPFPHIPICRANAEIGCVVAYSSFRAEVPPAAGVAFEGTPPGTRPICANPAAFEGGSATLDAYLSTSGAHLGPPPPNLPVVWTNPPVSIGTPFVKAPGLLSASCVENGQVTYLAVALHPSPNGHRIGDITGDLFLPTGKVDPNWGLHFIDINLTMGNLLAMVGDQAKVFLERHKQ